MLYVNVHYKSSLWPATLWTIGVSWVYPLAGFVFGHPWGLIGLIASLAQTAIVATAAHRIYLDRPDAFRPQVTVQPMTAAEVAAMLWSRGPSRGGR